MEGGRTQEPRRSKARKNIIIIIIILLFATSSQALVQCPAIGDDGDEEVAAMDDEVDEEVELC